MQAHSARESQVKQLTDQCDLVQKRILWLESLQKRTELVQKGLGQVSLLDAVEPASSSSSSSLSGTILTRFSQTHAQ